MRGSALGSALVCVWGLMACEAEPVSPGSNSQALGEAPKAACCSKAGEAAKHAAPNLEVDEANSPAATRAFGAKLDQTESVSVSEVLSDPSKYLGSAIQCTGVVARVCERAGCWLELRGESDSQQIGLRVPMAGHAFFIPQDVVGRPARVEGTLTARELGAGERAHLEGEGLKAIGPLALTATGVVIY